MVETLMALWNRGVSGRLIVMVVTFFCICISISLLFVTVGSAWGSLFARGRTGGEEAHMVNSPLITATAPTSVATEVATSPVVATPTIMPNPCLASPTGARGYSRQVDVTRSRGRTSVPTVKTSATPEHRRKTPPGVTITPSPTLPAVTPTVTLAATTLPTVTPTVEITPTDTSTPGATPTPPLSTPTTGLAPTDTATPNETVTVITTPTVTAPASSPTATTSATTGMGSRHIHGGGPLPGTPSSGQSGKGNCFSDSLATSGEGSVLSLLQNFLWIILVSSLLGTALFCAQMYRVSRNFRW